MEQIGQPIAGQQHFVSYDNKIIKDFTKELRVKEFVLSF